MYACYPKTVSVCQGSGVITAISEKIAEHEDMSTNGIDLAKAVFQIRGVDNRGKIVLCKQLSRVKTKFFANLTRCLVGEGPW